MILIFDNRKLENAFRRLTDCETEVGGWLFYHTGTAPNHNRRILKSCIGTRQNIGIIQSWLVVPNESKTPETQMAYAQNMTTFQESARMTAFSQGYCSTINFHTHPNCILAPSPTDIQFWLKYCNWADNKKTTYAEGVIAGRAFNGLVWYDLTLDKPTNRYRLQADWGYSWRGTAMKEYAERMASRKAKKESEDT